MKRYFTLIFLFNISNLVAQGKWTKKLDLPDTSRIEACSFAINGKGYLIAGKQGTYYFKDVWEYDPINNTWLKKVDFPGAARREAVAFEINGKGYVGTGRDASGAFNDFWEYEPTTDKWTKKANYPGGVRRDATGFSIGNKGYIGTGQDPTGSVNKNDFYEYDPTLDKWTAKANFPGVARNAAIGFSIGNKGFIGLGRNSSGTQYSDIYEFDPANNTWLKKADYKPGTREEVVSFIVGNIAYVGTGYSSVVPVGRKSDFYAFNPIANTWTKIDTLTGEARIESTSFEIAGKGYLTTGYGASTYEKDLWEYDPSAATININSIFKENLILFSNPNTRQITLALNDNFSIQKIGIHLFTSDGKTCELPLNSYELKNNDKLNISTENLSNGIYILKVSILNKVFTLKVVVAQ